MSIINNWHLFQNCVDGWQKLKEKPFLIYQIASIKLTFLFIGAGAGGGGGGGDETVVVVGGGEVVPESGWVGGIREV